MLNIDELLGTTERTSSGLNIDELMGFGKPEDNSIPVTQERINKYGSIQVDKPNLMDKFGSLVKTFGKGAGAATVGMGANVLGGLAKQEGETMGVGTTQQDIGMAMAGNYIPAIVSLTKKFVADRTQYDEMVGETGNEVIKRSKNFQKEHGLLLDSGESKFVYNLGGGSASLLTAIGLTMLTKNPMAIGVLFGAAQTGSMYQEGIKKGLSPDKARNWSTMAGVAEGALESLGLKMITNGLRGQKTVIRAIASSATEAVQEALQQTSEEIIAKVGFGREGTFKNALGRIGESALIGGILGAPTGTILALKENKTAVGDLRKMGLSDKEIGDIVKKTQEKAMNNNVVTKEINSLLNYADKIVRDEGGFARTTGEPSPKEVPGLPTGLTLGDIGNLEGEARKYGSAEEFVESQKLQRIQGEDVLVRPDFYAKGKVGYSDTIEDVTSERPLLQDKNKKAVVYRDSSGNPQGVISFNVKDDNTLETREEYGGNVEVFVNDGYRRKGIATKLFDKAKKLGYDLDTVGGQGYTELGTVLTKKRLTDIWNKAKKKEAPTPQQILGQKPAPIIEIRKRETTLLKERLKLLSRGAREGSVATKQQIREVQKQILGVIKTSDLDANDRAKFMHTINKIETQQHLLKALPEITNKINKLESAATKRSVSTLIQKELKRTKPIKSGQKRVGKFDYESNKLFDKLRLYNAFNQEKATLELNDFPSENLGEYDLIKKRFLSLKANGVASSPEIYERVHEDIKRIKEVGRQAKDDADLKKKLDRNEKILSTDEAIGEVKANKKTVKTKIGNFYRRGFSSIYSMFNSIAGKNFAENNDTELSENQKNTAIYNKTLDMTNEASKIYDDKNVMRLFERMSRKDYNITDVADNITTELSKLEIIDIYNAIKNNKTKEDYNKAYGAGQVQNLLGNLTESDENFGDMLQENVQEYREILNTRNIEITGIDSGFIENYWPGTSEFQASVFDDIKIQGETPSALKDRAKGRVIPLPKNAWHKAQRHIAQAEHVDKLSREYENLRRIFTNRRIKNTITQKFGDEVYKTLLTQIDNISLNKNEKRLDAVSGVFQKAINNWVTAKIALNPSTFVRQLMSVGNYVEYMGGIEWTKGFFAGMLHPKRTFDFMWNNAPFLEARFNKGYSEALSEAIRGAEGISVNRRNLTKFLTSLVRAGDITAIVFGGYPMVKAALAKGKSMKESISTFETATLKAQQSGLSSGLSQFQNSKNPLTRLFLAFKNTSNQYFRKMADSVISYQNGDITLVQFAKTMTIYAVIQPIMYASAGYATKAAFGLLGQLAGLRDEDPEEDKTKLIDEIMIQLAVSPVNAIPLLDDVVNTVARKLVGKKIYKVFSTPLLDDLETGLGIIRKKSITGKDYLRIATSILEPTTSLPIGTGKRYFDILTGAKTKKKKDTGGLLDIDSLLGTGSSGGGLLNIDELLKG